MDSAMTKAVAATVGSLVVFAFALFVPAGRLAWPTAWGLLLGYMVFAAVGFLVLDKELIAERTRLPPDAALYDLAVAVLAAIFLYPVTFNVCGLDVRFGWSPPIPAAVEWTLLAVFWVGYAFSLWAARTNRFFSSVVRIQHERGHRVVDSGPYAFVRHPGYAGPLLAHLVLPIALGSFWGLIPTLIGFGFLVLRTIFEEHSLIEGLPGYRDYTRRVRWRLFPYVW
jgi:protein-S-isoprenylcysteine O-methyltransferase Ste14